MKLNLHFFPLGLQIPQKVIVFSRSPWDVQIELRAVLRHLYMQLSVVYKFCNIVDTIVFTV